MPIARFKGVLLCSSEDKNHPATNLIHNANKKWRCEETGPDRTAYVILQLEKPTRISGIDIGNECSAFIEVSVGRTGWPAEKFKTILVSSSFMTIADSRNMESPNRVRCFNKDALMPEVAEEKWELVKVTCTQGFNKQVLFGLSFITIHTPDAVVVASGSESSPVKASPKEKKSCDEALGLPKNSVFAKFRMRVDSSDSSDSSTAETSSSLFSKWKNEKNSPIKDTTVQSAAAAIRDASSSMSKLEECTKISHKIATPAGKTGRPVDIDEKDAKKTRPNRYRSAILYDDDDENTSNPILEKIISEDKERIERERKELLDKKKMKKDISREEKAKAKMEASAEKFKMFLQDDIPNQSQDNGEKTAQDNADNDVDDDIVEMKAVSPAKDDLTASTSPHASRSRSPDPSTPPAWRVKNKRQSTSEENSDSKRSRVSTSPDRNIPSADLGEILQGVVFVISGIQNPDRAEIRSQGLQLGARYRSDWDDSCTHLICAFKNTPKYKQVKGSGIIVNKRWIGDCFAQKKKLPWQDYVL